MSKVSKELIDSRALQIEQGELWNELKVQHLWIHVVRGKIHDGEIARVGAVPFCVYITIKSHTDMETGTAFPSIPTIAKLVGVSNDTVERALKKLVEAGLLEVEKKGRRNSYSIIEEVQLVDTNGQHWGSAKRKYASLKYGSFIEDLRSLARSGNFPGDPNITLNVTVNVHNIVQGDNSNVTVAPAQQHVHVRSDDELRKLIRGL